MQPIVIRRGDLRECLKRLLERNPTDEELLKFREWIERDVGEWLRDNAKSWVRDQSDRGFLK